MEERLPVLVSRPPDKQAVVRLLRAALRHEVAKVTLEKPPSDGTSHRLDIVGQDGESVSVLAELAGSIAGSGAVPLRLRPLHRAQAAQLYAMIEAEQQLSHESLAPSEAPSANDLGARPEESANHNSLVYADTVVHQDGAPPSGSGPTSRAIIAPPSMRVDPHEADSLDPSMSVAIVFESDLPPDLAEIARELGSEKDGEQLVAIPDIPNLPALEIGDEEEEEVDDDGSDLEADSDNEATLVRSPSMPPPPPQEDAPPESKKKLGTKQPKSSKRGAKITERSTDEEASVALTFAKGVEDAPSIPPTSMRRDPLVLRDIAGGKYTIESLIGSGAAGAVYKARHRDLRRTVAIKVLHPHFQHDVGFMKRFHGEALAASQLDHPNIMRVIDFGQESDGLLYIVMEFLSGRTLQGVLDDERRLAKERAIELMIQTCAALSVAHDHGIIHRDIKPDNIVLVPGRDDEGNTFELVKVCDFGIAALEDTRPEDADMQFGAGVVCGTPEYMSPEQASAGPVDQRTDIYACGITLYELVTGRPPFLSENPVETLVKHANEAPVPPSKLVKGLDPLLEEVILKAIQKDPAHRQQSARELRLELKEIVAPESRDSTDAAPRAEAVEAGGLEDSGQAFQQFFIGLASAIAGLGPFQSGHDDNAQALKHWKRATGSLLRGRGHVTFARRDTQQSIGFFVLTRKGEVTDLRKLLGSQLHSTYGKPFISALAKRGVAALTFREGVPEPELQAALELLRQPESAAASLHGRFAEQNPRHVSMLFPQDVIGRERKLSWKVGLSIARLARDLVLLANARGIGLKKARELRGDLIADTVHMLAKPEELASFVVHGDVVQTAVMRARGLASFDVGEAVMEVLSVPRCTQTAADLILRLDQPQEGEDAERVVSLLKLIAKRLVHERTSDSNQVLGELHKRRILANEDLPPDLALSLRAEALADALARDPTPFLRALDATTDLGDFAAGVTLLATTMRVLAKRGASPALLAAVTTLARHARGSGGKPGSREDHALRALKSIIDKDRLLPIANVLMLGHPQLREPARQLLVLAGSAGAQALFIAREQLRDPSGRPMFVHVFRETGAAGTPILAAAIAKMDPSRPDFDLPFAEDLLRAVPDRRDPAVGDAVLTLRQHPRLKRFALTALASAWGERAKPFLLEALESADEQTRVVALGELRRIHGVDDFCVTHVERILANRGASEELRAAAASALSDVAAPFRHRAISLLSRSIEGKRGLVAMLRKAETEDAPTTVIAMAIALLALDRSEGTRVVRERAMRSDPELRSQLSVLVTE